MTAVPSVYLSEGFPAADAPDAFASSTGTLNALMLFVDFLDAEANDTTQSLQDLFLPDAPDWYATASYGKLKLDVKVPEQRFYRMPSPSTSYNWERGFTAETHYLYISDALASVGDAISFSGIEVLYIVPTTAATTISFSPTYNGPVTAPDGSSILKTVTFGQDVPNYWGFKTMNHETGHAMGLPDLYPLDGDDTTRWVGGFDIMGLISGVAPDFGAWHKWKLGWLEDGEVGCVGADASVATTFTLTPLETPGNDGDLKAVVVAKNETAALVAEARTTYGVDGKVCAAGVLIYAVYTDVATGEGPIRVFDSTPDSGGCDGDELNDAPYDNATFESEEFGVSIAVSARQGVDWTVTVSKG